MKLNRWMIVASLTVTLLGSSQALADTKPAAKDLAAFGALRSPALEQARNQAQDWLKSAGHGDVANSDAFKKIWAETNDQAILDRVTETLILGCADAKKLMAEARDPNAPPPTKVPDLLTNPKCSAYFRSNLALAYAKALSNRRVFEEALESLKLTKVEQVVDPATFLFHKAVAEYSTASAESVALAQKKKEVEDTIARLLDDVVDAPERYKMVAALMHFDMLSWKDKDLGNIARKMDNVERRLELARGGPKTQKQQDEIVRRLEELIKQLENQQKQQQQQGQGQPKPGEGQPQPGNGGQCPEGGQQPGQGQLPNGIKPSSPAQESGIATQGGPGNVDAKKFEDLAKNWGSLPEKERAAAMRELTRGAPPQYREMIENYFKKLAQADPGK